MGLAIDLIAIVLAIVATIVTVVGFFASLHFYRDGVDLQTKVQRILTIIEERVGLLQTQVGGMFDKTLDAAIGRANPQSAAEAQGRLLKEAVGDERRMAEGKAEEPEQDNLAQEAMDYFAANGLKYTDVTSGDAQVMFSLGSPFSFNMFDGPQRIIFFGFFHREDQKKIATRIRFLLRNIGSAYERISAANGELAETGRKLLDSVEVIVMVSEDADKDRILAVAEAHQPDQRSVPIKLLTPSELREKAGQAYEETWNTD